MFNWSKNKIPNKKPDKNKQTLENNEILCSASFELAYDGSVSIRYFWPKFTNSNKEHIPLVANDFAYLLFMINTGMLENDMVETFSNMTDKQNNFDNTFANETLNKWLHHANDMTPIIHPSNVFGQYNK